MVCPKCKENTAHRSERISLIDHTANRFFFKPYTCGGCRHRFHALRRDMTWPAFREEMGRQFRGFRPGREGKRTRRELAIYLVAGLVIMAVIYYIAQQRA